MALEALELLYYLGEHTETCPACQAKVANFCRVQMEKTARYEFLLSQIFKGKNRPNKGKVKNAETNSNPPIVFNDRGKRSPSAR